MDFRRSGQLDERRRRVLMDEIASPAESESDAAANSAAKGPIRAYAPSVLSEQRRVTDLIPVRPLWVVVVLLLGLTAIATIEAIHVHVAMLTLPAGRSHLAALDARERGSLAAWFSSSLFALSALAAVGIFSIRCHRVDDYRGRYRVWLWIAAALAWLSLDCATGVHHAIGLGLNVVAGRQLLSGTIENASSITWLTLYGLVLGALGLRLAFEVFPSRLSFAALIAAAVAYTVVTLFELQIITAPSWMIPGTLESLSTMLAHGCLFASLGLYARQVYLDATGRLKVRIDAERKTKAKPRAKLKVVKADKGEDSKERPEANKTASEPAKFAAAASSSNAASKPGAAISKGNISQPAYDEDDEEDDSEYGDNLSKSERRRLKKMARREQRRAA